MKKIVLGILAHVDAGKTTLSENLLYISGIIRKLGRVDNCDTFLDTNELEKNRGITIFSKQAVFNIGNTEFTLIDTPGHVDFSLEMERTLQVLDYAILVINGGSGVQSHTKTLWSLLNKYNIPTFIFVNKMDQPISNKENILAALKSELEPNIIEYKENSKDFYEELSLLNEDLLNEYLEKDKINLSKIKDLIGLRRFFPVFFGSALKNIGTTEFSSQLDLLTLEKKYPSKFSAVVYKISRDKGERLTHLRITGGSLKVKENINIKDTLNKPNEIRIYSGDKYNTVQEAQAGTICAVTGLNNSYIGLSIGKDNEFKSTLAPVLKYKIILPDNTDEKEIMPLLQELEEEDPELNFTWDENLKEIGVNLMGDIQTEILQAIILDRWGINIGFGDGEIVYRETISKKIEGVGHFEPLRHYAEVHLLLEPLPLGSGLDFHTSCSQDILNKSFQNLILTHLKEKEHIGVLTGSPITDMKITLVTGKAHNKHTTGGDFREATYRALRNGLKRTESVLLEPYYSYRLEIEDNYVGRAMTDIENMNGSYVIESNNDNITILTGKAPVSKIRNYQKDVTAYSKGYGKLSLTISGYDKCNSVEKIMTKINYDSELDVNNPTGSVFCAKGTSLLVPYNEVENYMHLEYVFSKKRETITRRLNISEVSRNISNDEIDAIFNKTFYSNKNLNDKRPKRQNKDTTYKSPHRPTKYSKEYLLVDGYNIIFAWDKLKIMAKDNLNSSRIMLLDILSNYRGLINKDIIVVFDAYKVEGRKSEIKEYNNINVVFTATAQTADEYIERFATIHNEKYKIYVATSDSTEQVIIRGKGCILLSARDLKEEVDRANKEIKDTLNNTITY